MTLELTRRFPGIQIAGAYAPPFRPLTDAEEAEVKSRIETGKPHLLWIGLGGPKQEFWCAQHLGKFDVPVMLAVGAAFDFISGNRPWAPVWIRRIGMEWLYRAFTGGWRTFFRNLRCVSMVAIKLMTEYLAAERRRRAPTANRFMKNRAS